MILVCYGGAYGITPAFAADYFGPHHVGPIFGLMLLPWAFPAAFGPLLFAYLRQATGGYNQALYLIAGMITVAMILPLLVSPPHGHKVGEGIDDRRSSAFASCTWSRRHSPERQARHDLLDLVLSAWAYPKKHFSTNEGASLIERIGLSDRLLTCAIGVLK